MKSALSEAETSVEDASNKIDPKEEKNQRICKYLFGEVSKNKRSRRDGGSLPETLRQKEKEKYMSCSRLDIRE